jgi:hypothetical protein|nr:MAG TPA: hypothetical protein [Caudoviricetes sp.]
MRMHKKININTEEIGRAIVHKDLIKRAVYSIEQYNERKKESLCFTYSGSSSRASEWGYLLDVDIDWLDNYFIGILEMKAITKASWDNKYAERIYFFESEEV